MPGVVTEPVDLQALKDRNPLAEAVEASGVHLRGRGRVLQGRCPFHEEREGSFTVYQDTQKFYCFGCGARGDVLDFLCRLNDLKLPEAIERLNGGSLVAARTSHRRAATDRPLVRAPEAGPRDATLLTAALRCYAGCLRRSPQARGYLVGRGITLETAARVGLGYGGDGLQEHLASLGFMEGRIAKSGLFLGERDRFAGRVVVPEIQHGRVTWLTGRSIDGAEPRFQALPGDKPLLGLGGVRNAPVVVLTEGVFDWLALVQWGLPGCATLGCHALDGVAPGLARARRVYLAMDNDPAGQEATARLRELLGRRAVPVSLPEGVKDVADLAMRPNGKQTFLRQLALGARAFSAGVCRPVTTAL